MNFYQQQFACLTAALRHAGRTSELAEQFFRHYHGYKDHAKAWALFSDTGLLNIAVGLFVTRRSCSAWRRLWCITMDELNRRQLLPASADDLRVAWDICQANGKITTESISMLEVWTSARPLLVARSLKVAA
jgi:hypothetical protein